MTLPLILATRDPAPVVVTDPTPQGGTVATILPPTSQNLSDWSSGMTALVAILDGLIADIDAEITELDARRLKLVADKAKTTGVRTVVATYAQGAHNWSTVVKP